MPFCRFPECKRLIFGRFILLAEAVKVDGAGERGAVCGLRGQSGGRAGYADRAEPLRPVYLADDLFACQSVVKRLVASGDVFLFTTKEASHKALYDFIAGAELDRHEVKVRKGSALSLRRC